MPGKRQCLRLCCSSGEGRLRDCAAILYDPRDRARTEHDFLMLLRQRVFALVAGYEDCNDHDRLRADPVLKIVAGRPPTGRDLASQPLLSRFENRHGPDDASRHASCERYDSSPFPVTSA